MAWNVSSDNMPRILDVVNSKYKKPATVINPDINITAEKVQK